MLTMLFTVCRVLLNKVLFMPRLPYQTGGILEKKDRQAATSLAASVALVAMGSGVGWVSVHWAVWHSVLADCAKHGEVLWGC